MIILLFNDFRLSLWNIKYIKFFYVPSFVYQIWFWINQLGYTNIGNILPKLLVFSMAYYLVEPNYQREKVIDTRVDDYDYLKCWNVYFFQLLWTYLYFFTSDLWSMHFAIWKVLNALRKCHTRVLLFFPSAFPLQSVFEQYLAACFFPNFLHFSVFCYTWYNLNI